MFDRLESLRVALQQREISVSAVVNLEQGSEHVDAAEQEQENVRTLTLSGLSPSGERQNPCERITWNNVGNRQVLLAS